MLLLIVNTDYFLFFLYHNFDLCFIKVPCFAHFVIIAIETRYVLYLVFASSYGCYSIPARITTLYIHKQKVLL